MGTLRVSAEQFRRQLAKLLNRAGYGGEEVIVERYGTPVAVLIPYQTYQNLPKATAEPIKSGSKSEYAPFEQVPALAQEIEEARKQAGLAYETLAARLQAERLAVLREKYPDYAAQYLPPESA